MLTTPSMLNCLVVAGADCCVNVWDLQSERPVRTLRTSNSVYQLHRTNRPECVLLEVNFASFHTAYQTDISFRHRSRIVIRNLNSMTTGLVRVSPCYGLASIHYRYKVAMRRAMSRRGMDLVCLSPVPGMAVSGYGI